MKNYVCISNKGEMDINALRLLGASSKRDDDSKIGFFGSGLKYGLAYYLRNGYNIRIFSGNEEIILGVTETKLREKSFNVITVNDIPTSFTTDMGPDWTAYGALREIYCNALDEEDCTINTKVTDIEMISGYTKIYIEMKDESVAILDDMGKYFLSFREDDFESYSDISEIHKDSWFSTPNEIPVVNFYKKHEETGNNIYRMGILVQEDDKDSLYDYDCNIFEITESRFLKSSYTAHKHIRMAYVTSTNESVIQNYVNIFYESKRCIERDFSFQNSDEKHFTKTWAKVIGKKTMVPFESSGIYLQDVSSTEIYSQYILLPRLVCGMLKKKFPELKSVVDFAEDERGYNVIPEEQITKFQQAIVNRALEFFKECNYKLEFDYQIVEFLNPDTYGQALIKEKVILIGKSAINKGVHEVVATFIEEQTHIKTKAHDETRKMQNVLIDEFINYMKEEKAFVI